MLPKKRAAAVLSDRDLQAVLDSGELVIDPLCKANIQPASIDLRLGGTFAALPKDHPLLPGYIDPLAPPLEPLRYETVDDGLQYPLSPGGFALASTLETVTLGPGLVGVLAGKSSLARHGLAVECAGLVDPAFSGQLTLELFCQVDRTIMLTPGMLIAQLMVHRLSTPASRPYGSGGLRSRYQGQRGPTASRSHLKPPA